MASELDHMPAGVSDISKWPAGLVLATLEELTAGLDDFIDCASEILLISAPEIESLDGPRLGDLAENVGMAHSLAVHAKVSPATTN